MIEILHGDCLEILPTLEADSFHACVCDPPYEIGFMSRTWDRTGVAFRSETWAEVYRVLKPGAHLLAFGASRTFHRLACAIEDAGFEIRDTIMWLYGSGFPKSHDVSKAIDKRGGANIAWFGGWLRRERERRGISQRNLAERGGFYDKVNHGGAVANWELGLTLPTSQQFNKICDILQLPFERIEEAEREVIGRSGNGIAGGTGRHAGVEDTYGFNAEFDLTAPATDAARQWQGWGTALKPACEQVVVARKPLSEGTVAANVLKHSTGALNIDACRVETSGGYPSVTKPNGGATSLGRLNDDGWQPSREDFPAYPGGRWPPNVVHDGSPEVMDAFARFGTNGSGSGEQTESGGSGMSFFNDGQVKHNVGVRDFGDTGTAARFFYTAKAGADERLDSRHPTVKPVALMEWLVRLVTPPDGRVLDQFCGTGSTLVACDRLSFDAVGIEQDAQTVADAHEKIRRMRARRMIGSTDRTSPDPKQLRLF